MHKDQGRSLREIGLFLFAVAFALLPAGQIFQDGRVFFVEGDNYVHLRKIMLHLSEFPRFVVFDPYEGYPVGTGAIWPPVIDWLLSALAMLVGLGRPTPRQVEVLAALVPPLIGGLTVVVLYRFARRILGEAAALIAAATLPLFPTFVTYVVVGRPDNEMAEPLMTLVMLSAYLTLQEQGALPGRKAFLAALRVGIAGLGTLLLWRGAPALIGLLFVGAIVDSTIDLVASRPSRRHLYAAATFLVPALGLAPLCALNVWGNTNTMSYNVVSWFHVAFFLLGAGIIALYGGLAGLWLRRGYARGGFFAFVALGTGALLLAALFLAPAFRWGLGAAFGVLGLGVADPWLQSVGQYRPFLSSVANIPRVLSLYGWTFWLTPLAWVIMARGARSAGTRARVFFSVSSLLLLALLLLRSRFEHIYAPFVAMATGFLLTAAHRQLRRALAKRRSIAGWAPGLGTAAIMVALLYPLEGFVLSFPVAHPGVSARGDIQDAMEWLRENSPRDWDHHAPAAAPAYGVMAPWYYAGWVVHIAQRPVVASIYGSEAPGMPAAAAFYTAESAEEAHGIMERNGVRFVVCAELRDSLDVFAQIAGRPPGEYFRYARPPGRLPVGQPTSRYYRLLPVRLHFADGVDLEIGGIAFAGAEQVRLVYESAGRLPLSGAPLEIKRLKIFEHLPGVRLVARTDPGQRVEVRARVVTNRGRTFQYERSALADGAGRVEMILPYAAPTGPGAVGLAEPYTVAGENSSFSFAPEEIDVQEGRTFVVPL